MVLGHPRTLPTLQKCPRAKTESTRSPHHYFPRERLCGEDLAIYRLYHNQVLGHPYARRRGGRGTRRPRRPTGTCPGLDSGPICTYNPSVYTSRSYGSGGACGSDSHGERPHAMVARLYRPP